MKYTHCPVDNTVLRPMFKGGKAGGKNSKLQRTRWSVCERGHQLYRGGRHK